MSTHQHSHTHKHTLTGHNSPPSSSSYSPAPPYTTSLPDQVRLRPGDTLLLQCLAHGSHPITFRWTRVGRAGMPAGAETIKDGQLLIGQVKLNDSGTYKCVATNHVGSSEALAKVTVKGEM